MNTLKVVKVFGDVEKWLFKYWSIFVIHLLTNFTYVWTNKLLFVLMSSSLYTRSKILLNSSVPWTLPCNFINAINHPPNIPRSLPVLITSQSNLVFTTFCIHTFYNVIDIFHEEIHLRLLFLSSSSTLILFFSVTSNWNSSSCTSVIFFYSITPFRSHFTLFRSTDMGEQRVIHSLTLVLPYLKIRSFWGKFNYRIKSVLRENYVIYHRQSW